MIEIAKDRNAATEMSKDREELTEKPISTLGRPSQYERVRGKSYIIYRDRPMDFSLCTRQRASPSRARLGSL